MEKIIKRKNEKVFGRWMKSLSKFKNNIRLNSIIDTNVIFIDKYMVVNLELV